MTTKKKLAKRIAYHEEWLEEVDRLGARSREKVAALDQLMSDLQTAHPNGDRITNINDAFMGAAQQLRDRMAKQEETTYHHSKLFTEVLTTRSYDMAMEQVLVRIGKLEGGPPPPREDIYKLTTRINGTVDEMHRMDNVRALVCANTDENVEALKRRVEDLETAWRLQRNPRERR